MRLSRIVIRNFKSLDKIEFFIPKTKSDRPGSAEFVSIVGENNAGKSSVLEAIRLACTDTGFTKPDISHFSGHEEENGPIEIEMEFDELTPEDREMQAIRKHVHNDRFWVKFRWDSADASFDGYALAQSYSFPTAPDSMGRKEILAAGEDWQTLLHDYEATTGKKYTKSDKIAAALKDFVIDCRSPVAVPGDVKELKNPGGLKANLATVLPRVIFVPAIRETKEETQANKSKSTVRQIVNILFERTLSGHPVLKRYEESAEHVKDLFEGEHKHQFVRELEQQITAKLKRLIDIEALFGFTPPSVTDDLAQKTYLKVRDGEIVTDPEDQGHGAQRALILALLEHLAEVERQHAAEDNGDHQPPLLLLIEEPEIYLHPEMCRKMRDVLLNIARQSTAQVICTTHSPIFLDLADRQDGIVILKRAEDTGTVLVQREDDVFDGPTADEQRQRLRMILNFDSSVNEVFFTDEVCIVEGDCEISAVDAVAKKLVDLEQIDQSHYLLTRRRLSLVNARGKWTILPFQKVLNAFGILHRVVHDIDAGPGPQAANSQILELLDNKEVRRLTHDPNFEEQIFREEWTKDKPWKATKSIHALDEVTDDLKKFFEFVLGKTIAELIVPLAKPELRADPDEALDEGSTSPLRRDLRDKLPRMAINEIQRVKLESADEILTLAAGPTRTPNLTLENEIEVAGGGQKRFIACVKGDSMADTLFDGDLVVIEAMHGVELRPLTGDNEPVSLTKFKEHVVPGEIYIIAMNEEIGFDEYTLKRVYVYAHEGDAWTCIISADNPETPWGDRGRRIILESDHIQFAAKLIALVEGEQ